MPINPVNVGTAANNGTGDPLRLSFQKLNANDTYIKTYAENLIQGLKWKQRADLATTANITLSGEQTIDGVLTAASRIVVKDQANKTENGLYTTDAGAWIRTLDADLGSELVNATVSVVSGTVNANTNWTCNAESITIGTTDITFVSFKGADGVNQGTFDAAIQAINDELDLLDGRVTTLEGNPSATWGSITGTLSNQTDVQTALNAKANDSIVVKSISLNGGTPQTPTNGLVDLTVSIESAEVHTEVTYTWNTGDSQIFTVADSAKTTDVYVQGNRLIKGAGEEWNVNTATGVEILIPLNDTDKVAIVSSATAAGGSSYDDTALTLIAKTDVISFFIGGSGKLVLGDAAIDMFASYDFTLTGFFAGVTDAPTGSSAVFDLKKNGVSVTSSKAIIDVNEFTSLTGTAPVLTTTSFLKGDKMTGVISQTDALETATAPILNLEIIKS